MSQKLEMSLYKNEIRGIMEEKTEKRRQKKAL